MSTSSSETGRAVAVCKELCGSWSVEGPEACLPWTCTVIVGAPNLRRAFPGLGGRLDGYLWDPKDR